MTFYINDYGLSSLQLMCKHSPDGDGAHPGFATWEWRNEVSSHKTMLGYWDWVKYQIEKEREELDESSPYNLDTSDV